MKLEELLGEELYQQVQAKIDAANQGQEDKLKHIRFADLSEGGYVSVGKFNDLQNEFAGKQTELEKANGLIEELKKAKEADLELQSKIGAYEAAIQKLQAENNDIRIDSALKLALTAAGARDVDYLIYKARAEGTLELEEDGTLKDGKALIDTLRTKSPALFQGDEGGRKVFTQTLPQSNGQQTVTKEQFASMGYAQRLKLKAENPEMYKNLVR